MGGFEATKQIKQFRPGLGIAVCKMLERRFLNNRSMRFVTICETIVADSLLQKNHNNE